MARNVAAPKNTGGGGFVFEGDVCSGLMAAMLVGEPVFGVEYGPPLRLEFQTRPDGWLLDDILVTTELGADRHRFALSVKSNTQFTAASAPQDFVAAAWEQWLHIYSTVFDPRRDFMGLVITPLSGAASNSVKGLYEKARANDASRFPSRLAEENWANADEHALFKSFACPQSVRTTPTSDDTTRLLQRLVFIEEDFGATRSKSENRALELCRRAVSSHTLTDAQTLWSILREIASELRPQAGSLTLSGLVDKLRARVALADYPDHAGDWARLDARSVHEAGLVQDSIAGRVHLARGAQVAAILQLTVSDAHVALLGPSGVGKSALAKSVYKRRCDNGERTLWVDASSFDRFADYGAFEASLQLQHTLTDLLGRVTSRTPVVIIDGIDRLYEAQSFRTVASLLRAVNGGAQVSRWRVLVVCQSQEWQRVCDALKRAGAPVARWAIYTAEPVQEVDLNPVRVAFPTLGRLLRQPRLVALLTNLKLLDIVAGRTASEAELDASALVGESSVAEWFWSAEVDRGFDRLARVKFARDLALLQADRLTVSVSVETLDASCLNAAESLIDDQILVRKPDDCLAFAHDLYADWARLRILVNHRADVAAFLQERQKLPLWHRAIRLLGIHLLEHENGVAEWTTLMSSLGGDNMTIVRDLILEAPAFAMNARPLLTSIFPSLVAGDGALLRRLLRRFLAFATVPIEQLQEPARLVGMDANEARATYRQPHWPYWLDVIAVLHDHRGDAIRTAAFEVAKVVQMWLEFTPVGSVMRREAAELAVLLGQLAVDSRSDYRVEEERKQFYKCALMAAFERPDEIAHLARIAAERIPRPAAPSDESASSQPRLPTMFSTGIMRGPWKDGPLSRVDRSFRHVVLDTGALRHLYQVRPKVAVEVILAVLIEPPQEEPWGSSWLHERALDFVYRPEWSPALYRQGPFLSCLQVNFAAGLELIMQLVDFATARSGEYAERVWDERNARPISDGDDEAEVEQIVTTAPTRCLALLGDGAAILTFEGDESVYGWSAGLYNPPAAIETSLMALEQYLYLRLDAGNDIVHEVDTVLSRTRSVAVLGILCDIGKRKPSLFSGPLRPLLSAPELYSWEINMRVHGRSHMMINAIRYTQDDVRAMWDFHGLNHRNLDLRYVALDLLKNSEKMRSSFLSVRDWWRERQATGERLNEMAGQLELWLDPINSERREDAANRSVKVNVALERSQAENAIEHQRMIDRLLVLEFPGHCRLILDERRIQTETGLNELWQLWSRICELGKAGDAFSGDEWRVGNEYLNAILGGVALFLWHNDWLSQDVTRLPVVEAALASVFSGEFPRGGGWHSDLHTSTWTWDCFLADSAAMLWASRPDDVRWRQLVARLVFEDKYAAVGVLFSRCAKHRVSLGDDFGRLRRLVIEWAHLRNRVEGLDQLPTLAPQFDEQVREGIAAEVLQWFEKSISSFVDGSLDLLSVHWDRFDEASRFADLDAVLCKRPNFTLINFRLVRVSHEWLPLPDEAHSPEERKGVVQFWRVALDVVLAKPRTALLKRRRHETPDDDEVWVLINVAAVLLQLRPDEIPEQLWAAIIDLHGEAHFWPTRFLGELHHLALESQETPANYGPLLREIARRAFSDVNDELRWPPHKNVWDVLLGIDDLTSNLWSDRHAGHVIQVWDVIALWMEKAPQERQRLAKFAGWLSKPAAAPIRLRVLPWFLGQIQPYEKRADYSKDKLEDNIAGLLGVVWDQKEHQLRPSQDESSAFHGLLVWLVELQNPRGLELHGRIGSLG